MAQSPFAAERAARRDLARARDEVDRLTGEDPRSGGGARGWFGAAVAVVVVLAVVAAVAVARQAQRDTWSDADYRTFATDTVGLLLTPDSRDPDRAQRILELSTGTFRDEFAQSTGAYSAFVARLGTVATGVVDGVAIAGRTGDTVSALVTSVVTTRVAANSSARDTAEPRRFRLRVQIEPDGGALRLAAVEFLP
ncbi:hypothetical protein [Williamsia maris]|uniref:Mce-associated membrane protein n=1 Tax=Williamsia maris TaxID=72806 RepID=A0ABT1HI35_9NOCA|nr:hypothetical protein [Williamsia maris]MCP2177650.1 Mce-associated membrane protein [Williamsia maris]